jgi:hypothetical protein
MGAIDEGVGHPVAEQALGPVARHELCAVAYERHPQTIDTNEVGSDELLGGGHGLGVECRSDLYAVGYHALQLVVVAAAAAEQQNNEK